MKTEMKKESIFLRFFKRVFVILFYAFVSIFFYKEDDGLFYFIIKIIFIFLIFDVVKWSCICVYKHINKAIKNE